MYCCLCCMCVCCESVRVRIVLTGVPQGSKLSPSLFNYYIADMPRPTPTVKRVCYANDITVWASGPKIPQLESMINSYLRDVSMKYNSILISAPKTTVMLFTPDKHQFQTHPDITLEDTQLPLERSPKILGVIIHPYPSTRTATMCQIGSTRKIIC